MDTSRFIYRPEEGAALAEFDPTFNGGFAGEDEARECDGAEGSAKEPL